MQPEEMTEAQLLDAILNLCQERDLWPVRIEPGRFNQRGAKNRGFPDLMVFGPGGVLFRELKTMAGNGIGRGPNPAQSRWKHRLLSGGHDWAVWTPADLASERIEEELSDVETSDEHSDKFSLAMARDVE